MLIMMTIKERTPYTWSYDLMALSRIVR